MIKKKLTRIIALCMACLGMGVFAFSGCKKGDGGSSGGGSEISGSGSEDKKEEDDKKEDDNPADDKKEDDKKEDDKPADDKKEDDDKKEEEENKPEISVPVQGGPTITKCSSKELETAYVEWTAADNAEWYNVYVSPAGEDDWTKLDAPLVREYPDYFRADAVGLAEGSYDMKVVPVSGDDEAATEHAAKASGITVKAHTREGFAFVKGTASGAYNEDGTLKEDAKVIYITNENKDSISLTLNTGKTDETFVGLQPILTAMKKAGVPLAVRLIGNVQSIKKDVDADNTVLIKENAEGITFEGIGNDATANGWTLRIVRASNVEVRNLGFMNTQASEPDNITLESDDHVWVHNCDLFYGGAGGDSDQAKGDGALDTKLSTYITHSYNHFWDSGKCNLQGMKKESSDNYITYHHNWYDHSDSRHPRIRTCTTHIYNNYFDGNAKYGVGVTTGASAFVESNYFRSTSTMKPMLVSAQGTDAKGEGTFSGESGGIIKAFGNCFDGKYSLVTQNDTNDKSGIDCYLATTRDEVVPAEYTAKAGTKSSEGAGNTYNNFDTASDMYEYTADSAEVAKTNVERYAGRIDGGDFSWTFDNATEDSNYSIISALKTALTNYKGSVVKIDGVAVSNGSTGGGTTGGGESGEGGDTPSNPSAPIEGKVVYNPNDGASGTYGIFTVTGGYKSGSTAVEIEGITIASGKAVKFNSGGSVSFTVDRKVTLTVYINLNGIKINDGTKITGTQSADGNYYTITAELEEGTYTVKQGAGESQLYLLTLVPA